MNNYFKINLEFDHDKLEKTITEVADSSKGYCCFVDSTSLVYAHSHEDFRKVLNNSVVNSCDGSYIALMASMIHHKKLKEYIGPEFFEKYIFHSSKHLIIGNTETVYRKIKEKVNRRNGSSENISYF